ncbi:MFS transporter [Cellulosimicrobium cellulans]|uniref:MFS transporter n=1 Tax=Cellulosimicrobium cellulans TaxID=1710 RepID=UPI0036EBA7FB
MTRTHDPAPAATSDADAPAPGPETATPRDAAPAAPGERPATLPAATQRVVMSGMFALVLLGAFEALAVATAMPTVASALDGLSLYAVAFAGTIAASVVGMVVGGRWGDRSGPSAPLLVGVGLFLVGLLVAGLAPSMEVFVAGRVLQGLGSGTYLVALYVLVARVYPEERRPRVFAAFAAAWMVPSIVGPAIAGLVVQHAGWRWVFLAVPVLAVPALALMWPGLRAVSAANAPREVTDDVAPADGAPGRAPLWWAVVAAAGVGLLHVAGQHEGLLLAVLLAAALGVIAAAVPRLLPRGTARAASGLPAVIAIGALIGAAFTGTEVLLPLLLSHERGLSPAAAGAVLTFGAVGWSVAAWVRGHARWAWPHVAYVRLGTALITLGVGAVTLLALPGVPTIVGMLAWTVAGTGMGFVSPTVSVLTLELSAVHQQGANSSALQVANALAAAVALAITGSLLWALRDALGLGAYVVCFGITAAVALTAFLVAPRTRPAPAS